MPGARTHDMINLATAVARAPLALAAGLPAVEVGTLAAAFLFSGFFFSPDLDLHSAPYMRWRGLRFLWLPYQKLVHHRSWVSHGLIVGPLIRILYIAVVAYLLALGALLLLHLVRPVYPTGVLWQATEWLGAFVRAHPLATGLVLAGFIVSGAVHTIADLIQTAV